MPDCALAIFLSILAVNSMPAAIVLLAGGLCWAATLTLVATLCAGVVTVLSVAVFLLLRWLTDGLIASGAAVGAAAILFDVLLAGAFFRELNLAGVSQTRFWIVSLHDWLHSVSS